MNAPTDRVEWLCTSCHTNGIIQLGAVWASTPTCTSCLASGSQSAVIVLATGEQLCL